MSIFSFTRTMRYRTRDPFCYGKIDEWTWRNVYEPDASRRRLADSAEPKKRAKQVTIEKRRILVFFGFSN